MKPTSNTQIPPSSTNNRARRVSILKKFNKVKSGSQDLGKLEAASGITRTSQESLLPTSSTIDSSVLSTASENVGGVLINSNTVSAEMDVSTSMLPPPPPPPPLPVGGSEVGGDMGSTGTNMRKLLEDLHRSRIRFDQDQKELDKTRLDIENANGKISKLRVEESKANEKFEKLMELEALKKADLNGVATRNKIVTETLNQSEQELNAALEELYQIRSQISQLSSSYLSETVQFGLQWNGTELGRENRILMGQADIENLERQKRQLEHELSGFLVLQKGVQECEKEVEELAQKCKDHDIVVGNKEQDLQTRINELDKTLKDLEREEDEFRRSSFDETQQLQRQIDDIQNSINYLENQNSEVSAAVKSQKNASKRATNRESKQGQRVETTILEASKKDGTFISNSNDQKSFDGKIRLTKFQVPSSKPSIQPSVSCTATALNKNLNFGPSTMTGEEETFQDSLSNSNDEDMCLVAIATEVSQQQRQRSYEPIIPMPKYTDNTPTPPKVRAVERQLPITGFMKQLSSTKVIKRPSKSSTSQGKNNNNKKKGQVNVSNSGVPNVQASIPSSGKSFQFKKKLSSSNAQSFLNQENSSIVSESSYDETNVDSTFNDENYGYGRSDFFNEGNSGVRDKPYSCFNSSRVLLTESQEQRLG